MTEKRDGRHPNNRNPTVLSRGTPLIPTQLVPVPLTPAQKAMIAFGWRSRRSPLKRSASPPNSSVRRRAKRRSTRCKRSSTSPSPSPSPTGSSAPHAGSMGDDRVRMATTALVAQAKRIATELLSEASRQKALDAMQAQDDTSQ
jgi:hypothetical protein